MILAFDIGNTTVKGAMLDASAWTGLLKVSVAPTETLATRLADAARASAKPFPQNVRCVVASVNPEAEGALREFIEKAGAARPEFFGRDLPVPIQALVREPSRVGVDRLLLALGARESVGCPCVVVSVGTAVTVDLVDKDGRFAGGAIAPGPSLMAHALHDGTAALPLVEPAGPSHAAGLDTTEAMQSGIYWFCSGGVQALVERLRLESWAGEMPVVVTGGAAHLLAPLSVDGPVHVKPDLIFIGMAAALEEMKPPSLPAAAGRQG